MKKIVIALLCTTFCIGGFCQSAEKVGKMVDSASVNLLDVSYIAATYLGLVDNSTSNENSLNALDRYTDFPKIKNEVGELRYKDFSYFCMRVWELKGGLFYRLTKSPHYAFRELQAKKIISPSIQSNDIVSGYDALTIMTKVIEFSEKHSTINLENYVKMPMKFYTITR